VSAECARSGHQECVWVSVVWVWVWVGVYLVLRNERKMKGQNELVVLVS